MPCPPLLTPPPAKLRRIRNEVPPVLVRQFNGTGAGSTNDGAAPFFQGAASLAALVGWTPEMQDNSADAGVARRS